MDLVQINKELEFGYSGGNQTVRNAIAGDALFGDSMLDFSGISFRDCLFQSLELAVDTDATLLPKFYSCYIGTLDGRVSRLDLPQGVFDKECVFDSFSSGAQNTAAILELPPFYRIEDVADCFEETLSTAWIWQKRVSFI